MPSALLSGAPDVMPGTWQGTLTAVYRVEVSPKVKSEVSEIVPWVNSQSFCGPTSPPAWMWFWFLVFWVRMRQPTSTPSGGNSEQVQTPGRQTQRHLSEFYSPSHTHSRGPAGPSIFRAGEVPATYWKPSRGLLMLRTGAFK